MISIKDIAKRLNVTPSTVSRALNGKKGVSKELASEILKTCQAMGYRKNVIAQSLITKESKLIGMIIPDITSRYYSFIVKGINTYLEEHGYSVILCNANRSEKNEKNYIDLLLSRRVDGIIIISLTATEDTLLCIQKTGTPIVQIDNAITEKISSITNDNYRGAVILFEHMVALGCKRIGLMMGRAENTTTIERLRGFRDVMAKHNIEVDENLITFIDSTDTQAYETTPKLLKHHPDSIFAINDNVALGVLRYCMDHNIKVPEQLRLAGYDDLDIARMVQVPLTTVHQLKTTLGHAAAKLMVQQIKHPNDPQQHITMIPHLVVRESLGEKLRSKPKPFNFN